MGATRKQALFSWGGILEDATPRIRLMAFTTLAISAICQVVVNLGFIGIGFAGEYTGYAMAILAPIALAGLLFGTMSGALIGVIAGVALLIHSRVQPLDYYEMLFISPVTSIVLLGAIGLLMGICFSIALRGNPTGWQRGLRIAVICICCSVLFTIGFQSSSWLRSRFT